LPQIETTAINSQLPQQTVWAAVAAVGGGREKVAVEGRVLDLKKKDIWLDVT
jgi:hypothetical protein